jgi:hypothetical protein
MANLVRVQRLKNIRLRVAGITLCRAYYCPATIYAAQTQPIVTVYCSILMQFKAGFARGGAALLHLLRDCTWMRGVLQKIEAGLDGSRSAKSFRDNGLHHACELLMSARTQGPRAT